MSLDPIHRHVRVALGPDDAFRLFTTGMGSWWPLQSHSRAEDGQVPKDVVFEDHVGGRIYELMTDGSEGSWGTVTAWDPGRRVVFDWRPNDEDRPHTEVEVRFAPAPEGGTDVELEHRGWERLGPILGPEARESYAGPDGWGTVLQTRFLEAAGAAS